MIEAPLIVLASDELLLDGVPLVGADDLAPMLRRKRELWLQFHPGQRFPGMVLLDADVATPAGTVKAAMRAAHRARFRVSFVVRDRSRRGSTDS